MSGRRNRPGVWHQGRTTIPVPEAVRNAHLERDRYAADLRNVKTDLAAARAVIVNTVIAQLDEALARYDGDRNINDRTMFTLYVPAPHNWLRTTSIVGDAFTSRRCHVTDSSWSYESPNGWMRDERMPHPEWLVISNSHTWRTWLRPAGVNDETFAIYAGLRADGVGHDESLSSARLLTGVA